MKKVKKNKVSSISTPNLINIQNKRDKIKKGLKRVEKKIVNPSPDYSKNLKPNKIKTNKLRTNPLFINFLNWTGDKYSIEKFLNNIKENIEDESDYSIIDSKIRNLDESYLNNLSVFQEYFKKNILETINNKSISDFSLDGYPTALTISRKKKKIISKMKKELLK